MRWEQGRAVIDKMLADGHLQKVPPSRERAEALLAQARNHLATAQQAASDDPEGAYALLYDAARKSLAAMLENQGLRVTSRGGHLGLYDAVSAQLVPPLGAVFRPFERLRRHRNALEYPDFEEPRAQSADVAEDSDAVEAIMVAAGRILDEMSPF
ncbi:MAG: HEPN domain-containing protein [Propionibacteriaceae bacterium]|jgi:HEPN domain-containing protein|nr:HEPN domain-containing protein [Propionibacteriaceae bacterium]